MSGQDRLSASEYADVVCEFIEVSVHLILYLRGVYPPEFFTRVNKYSIGTFMCRVPSVNDYIFESLRTIGSCMEKGIASKVLLGIRKDRSSPPHERFTFEVGSSGKGVPYSELENLQTTFRECLSCLHTQVPQYFVSPATDTTFGIFVLVEAGDANFLSEWIREDPCMSRPGVLLPLRSFNTVDYSLQVYIEKQKER